MTTASMPAPARYQQPYQQGLGLPGSSESSLSSTPVLEGSLAASLAASDPLRLDRTLSSLSLSENASQVGGTEHGPEPACFCCPKRGGRAISSVWCVHAYSAGF